MEVDGGHVFRAKVSYENGADRFLLPTRKFSQQYSQIYFNRLNMLRGLVTKVAEKRWG